jgi:hypothetical protein
MKSLICVLVAMIATGTTPALAQTTGLSTTASEGAIAMEGAATDFARGFAPIAPIATDACCRISAGTLVDLEIAEPQGLRKQPCSFRREQT